MARKHGGRRAQRRWAARACVGAAIVCLVLAGLGSAGAQEDAPARPDVFRSDASAELLSASLDRGALLPVNDAFHFIALDGTGTYESSNQTARASLFYPGNGIISGPGLACSTFGGQFPEQFAPILDACLQYRYPLTVFADSLNPDGATTGSLQLGERSDPVSGRAVRAVAHADDDASRTDAALADLRVMGLPAFGPVPLPMPVPGGPELDSTIVTVANATSSTDQHIDDAGRLIAEATTTMQGVRLVGGLIQIDSLRSVSRIVDDGRGAPSEEADLTIGGITVGGVPAQITDDGLVVGSPTGADGPLVQQLASSLNDLLRDLGVQITPLAVEHGEDDAGLAFARSGGVLVEYGVDVQDLPILPGPQGDVDPNGFYTGTIVLGQTGVRGLAAHIDLPESAALPPTDGGVGALPDTAGRITDTGGTFRPPAATGPAAAAPAPAAATPSAASATGGRQLVVSVSEALAPGRVRLTYLAFTFIALAMCIGPRFILPARLSGSRP